MCKFRLAGSRGRLPTTHVKTFRGSSGGTKDLAMCGLAGLLQTGLKNDRRRTVQRMADTLRHRGPDSEGFYVDGFFALGVRRLRIIDLETGDQPVSNETGTVWGALNGEIYNFHALRHDLQRLRHHFRTLSDTEVVVHAYEEWGEDCVHHLDGMFALAIWDGGQNSLLLAHALRQQLERSVRQQLVSDVPLGLFLSGGIDSSAITAIATQVCGRRSIKTFSLGFAEASYDERPFARTVARHCGTDHTEIEFSAEDAARLLERVGDLLDEPLVDSSFLPIYWLSHAARQTVTVVLSGDGGDELFCGYPTFLADRGARWVQRLPGRVQKGAARAVSHLAPSWRYGSVEFLLKQFFPGLPFSPEVPTQLFLWGVVPSERWTPLSVGLGAGFRQF